MILIEGTDGVGKSTLAKALARKYMCWYVRTGLPPNWWTSLDYITKVAPFAVFDRYHWSHLAYQVTRSHDLQFTEQDCREIDKALYGRCNHNYCKILLVADSASWFDDKTDSLYDVKQVAKVNEEFKRLANNFDIVWNVCNGFPVIDEIALLIAREIAK